MSNEQKLKDINFFICSTYTDLKNYREAVIEKIKSYAGIINAQEFFGARNKEPIETCLEEVRKSQIFILIIGMRYGSTVPKLNKSFVETEYDEAKKLKIPIYTYLIDEEYPIKSIYIDRKQKASKLDKFKKRVQRENTTVKFTSPENLSELIKNDLIRELPKEGYPINENAVKLIEKDTNLTDLISYFRTLPKIYYGKEFTIQVKFDNFERASKEVCAAFYLTYGASVKRSFSAIENEIYDALGYELRQVYAQHELAEQLIRYDKNKEVSIKVRTKQGTIRTKTPIYSERKSSPMLTVIRVDPDMYISGYETTENLIIGLELLEIH